MEGDRPLLPPFEYGAKRSGCAPCITAPFMSIDVQESLRGKSNVGDIDLTPRSSPATGRAPDWRSYGGGAVNAPSRRRAATFQASYWQPELNDPVSARDEEFGSLHYQRLTTTKPI